LHLFLIVPALLRHRINAQSNLSTDNDRQRRVQANAALLRRNLTSRRFRRRTSLNSSTHPRLRRTLDNRTDNASVNQRLSIPGWFVEQ
jgi:hypothetical protein